MAGTLEHGGTANAMLSRMVSLLLLSPVAASSMDSMELDAPPPPPPAVHSRTVTFCLSEIRASFAALDANGDGVLSQAELGIAPPVRPTISLTPGTASGGLNATSSGVLTPVSYTHLTLPTTD